MCLTLRAMLGAVAWLEDGVQDRSIKRNFGNLLFLRPCQNNADALAPALLAGLGLAVQPDFVVGDAIAEGRLEVVMPEWSPPPIALHLVMPPGGPRPARVEALAAFLSESLSV